MGSRIDSAPDAGTPPETAAGETAPEPTARARADHADPAPAAGEGAWPPAPAALGLWTLRDLVVVVSAGVVLVGSVLPFAFMQALTSAWLQAGWQFNQFVYFLLPLAVGVAFGWRRLAGRTRVRWASLTLDQIGSVVAVLSAAYFFFAGINLMSPAYVLCLLGALGLVAGTTAAPYIGAFAGDFAPGEGPLLARPVRPVARRAGAAERRTTVVPAAEAQHPARAVRQDGRPSSDEAAGVPVAGGIAPGGPGRAPGTDGAVIDPAARGPVDARGDLAGGGPSGGAGQRPAPAGLVAATSGAPAVETDPAPAPASVPVVPGGAGTGGDDVLAAVESPSHHGTVQAPEPSEAFWFAVPAPRDAVDPETRRPLFAVQPGEWNLALAERGDHLLVQHTDGRIGLLFDLEAIQRA
ncbi:hypothetical protein [Zhihengliuella sp.]|uniref:hypothetical protein n=1 Tax=Zhihengliuella sp. TaxID=1954483 RepID=UPI002811DD9C|nr:hypothetical protein [Zhihengliuella sp.]